MFGRQHCGSTENLCELEEISPRIAEESELATYDGKIKRLSYDCHTATAKLRDCCNNAVNHKARVVPAGKVQAVGQIDVRLALDCARTGEQFELEVGINCRCHIRELQIAVGPTINDAKVQFFSVPGDCFIDVGDANANVIALHRGEGARGFSGGESGG